MSTHSNTLPCVLHGVWFEEMVLATVPCDLQLRAHLISTDEEKSAES